MLRFVAWSFFIHVACLKSVFFIPNKQRSREYWISHFNPLAVNVTYTKRVETAAAGIEGGSNRPSKKLISLRNYYPSPQDLILNSTTTGLNGDALVRKSVGRGKAVVALSKIDIPLVARRELSSAKAILEMKWNRQGILIRQLVGHPLLRASLFDWLNQNKYEIEAFLADKLDWRVEVVFDTEFNSSKFHEFDENVDHYETKTVYTLKRHLGVDQYGVSGMVLDDEHSKKAKKRDQDHLQRLKGNAAFLKSMENRIVGV